MVCCCLGVVLFFVVVAGKSVFPWQESCKHTYTLYELAYTRTRRRYVDILCICHSIVFNFALHYRTLGFCHSNDVGSIAFNKYIIRNDKYFFESCNSIVFSCSF